MESWKRSSGSPHTWRGSCSAVRDSTSSPRSSSPTPYLSLAMPRPDASYNAPFDLDAVGSQLPREQWPARCRYTVRNWDRTNRLLTIDFVVHGDHGVAVVWAANARPGDVLQFTGPAGAYRPDPTAGWHLLVGDESALPAIAASLAAVAERTPVVVRLICDGPDDELALDTPGALDVAWRVAEQPSSVAWLDLVRFSLEAWSGIAPVRPIVDFKV